MSAPAHPTRAPAHRAIAAAVLCLGGGVSLAGTPPTFTGLGLLPGGTDSGALGVTPNGSVVVGYSTTPFGDRAFRWGRTTGMQSLGVLPGGVDSRALGVSADGWVIVGYSSSGQGQRAFRWTGGGGMKDLGVLAGGGYSLATGVSADGSVVVGYSDFVDASQSTEYRACRWTSAGGMENLGLLPGGFNSYAQGISADASVIVGVGDADGAFDFRAFRRADGAGMVNLGVLPDGNYTIAFGVSADGSTVVGYGREGAWLSAFRWNGVDGMMSLGRIPGSATTIARAVSGDGSVVVGSSEATTGDIAFIWTSALGLTDLNTYLKARGIDLAGWSLTAAYGISADGLTVVGTGVHNGHQEAWASFLGLGQDLSAIEQLGKSIMSDANLSVPAGQACFSCHSGASGFTNPLSGINAHGAVHPGAVPTRFGNRRPPTAAYAGASPPLHVEGDTWVGGMFFDGRATGWTLGDPLAEQALQPFLNPVEQNNPGLEDVVAKVAAANYAALFRDVWGEDSLAQGGDAGLAYERVVRSIAAYERSRAVNPFNSKYDDYLAGRVLLAPQELAGLNLFEGAAGCAACHPNRPGPDGEPPLFTDFTYDNIGIPRNPENPFYTMGPSINPDGGAFVDPGLGGFLQQAGFPKSVFGPVVGKHKVPTLRNVDRRPDASFVRAYGHNGYFKTLEDVVHFYNTRDVEAWPPPEAPQNVNIDEMGNLHLSAEEEAALVAFLKTLTDRDVTPIRCPADFDHNGFVNGDDYDGYMAVFESGGAAADFDRDGFVTGTDFDLFSIAFEAGC